MKKALLVIDLQEEYFENQDSFKNQFKLDMSNFHQRTFKSVDEYMNSVNKIIEKEQSLGTEIIYIQEVLPNKVFFRKFFGHSIEGTPGVELHHSLKKVNDTVFTKAFGDAFTNRKLKKYLKENGIEEIYIVGCDSTKCASFTAKGAIKNGIKVSMFIDGIFTFCPQDVEKTEKELEGLGVQYI